MQNLNYAVEARNLQAVYEDRVILDGIDFFARPSEVTVILGGSGCGKTTLLKHLIGLLKPKEGEVRLLGRNLGEMEEDEFDATLTRIGMLFQNGALFNSLTVAENIAFPLREHTFLPESVIDQVVRMKLSLIGMSGKENFFPPELSGGMRKRVALARAIALDPEVLFCDEPTAGLDPPVAAGLDNLILNLKALFNMAVIVVTHEIKSIETIADRAYMLDEGKIVAEGTLKEVKENPSRFVRDFFMRVAPNEYIEGDSLFTALGGE